MNSAKNANLGTEGMSRPRYCTQKTFGSGLIKQKRKPETPSLGRCLFGCPLRSRAEAHWSLCVCQQPATLSITFSCPPAIHRARMLTTGTTAAAFFLLNCAYRYYWVVLVAVILFNYRMVILAIVCFSFRAQFIPPQKRLKWHPEHLSAAD